MQNHTFEHNVNYLFLLLVNELLFPRKARGDVHYYYFKKILKTGIKLRNHMPTALSGLHLKKLEAQNVLHYLGCIQSKSQSVQLFF